MVCNNTFDIMSLESMNGHIIEACGKDLFIDGNRFISANNSCPTNLINSTTYNETPGYVFATNNYAPLWDSLGTINSDGKSAKCIIMNNIITNIASNNNVYEKWSFVLDSGETITKNIAIQEEE